MAQFKIRDLMVALRPGLQTPQRPAPLDCCDESSFQQDVARPQLDSAPGGGGGGSEDCCCTASCDGTVDCGCTASTECTCTGGCTITDCGCTGGCTVSGCGCTGGCTAPTCAASNCGCTNECTIGGTYRTGLCEGTRRPLTVGQMGATDLAKLKMQLKLAMQQVSRREKALATAAEAKAIVPQTVEQIDALQQKLTEAMDELRARRAEIQNSAAPETAKPPKD